MSKWPHIGRNAAFRILLIVASRTLRRNACVCWPANVREEGKKGKRTIIMQSLSSLCAMWLISSHDGCRKELSNADKFHCRSVPQCKIISSRPSCRDVTKFEWVKPLMEFLDWDVSLYSTQPSDDVHLSAPSDFFLKKSYLYSTWMRNSNHHIYPSIRSGVSGIAAATWRDISACKPWWIDWWIGWSWCRQVWNETYATTGRCSNIECAGCWYGAVDCIREHPSSLWTYLCILPPTARHSGYHGSGIAS